MPSQTTAHTATDVQDRFNAALIALVEQIKRDRSILAAILCGSLSHDTVWSKSDIDMVLVTIDERRRTGKVFPCMPTASTFMST